MLRRVLALVIAVAILVSVAETAHAQVVAWEPPPARAQLERRGERNLTAGGVLLVLGLGGLIGSLAGVAVSADNSQHCDPRELLGCFHEGLALMTSGAFLTVAVALAGGGAALLAVGHLQKKEAAALPQVSVAPLRNHGGIVQFAWRF